MLRKITITLPEELLKRLEALIPRSQRNQFFVTAIQKQLALLEQVVALEESAGAWTDENHPEMLTEADIDYWLAQLRKGWGKKRY